MKKYIIAIIACIVIIGVIFFVYFNQSTSQNSSPTPGTRMGTNTQISNNETKILLLDSWRSQLFHQRKKKIL